MYICKKYALIVVVEVISYILNKMSISMKITFYLALYQNDQLFYFPFIID